MVAGRLPVLSTFERRLVAAVVLLATVLLAGVVVAVVRRADIKAWLDAPEVLAVNAAALAVPLPGGAEDDPTRSACPFGSMRCAWVDVPPVDAVAEVAAGLAARDVDVDGVLCDDPALPPGPLGGTFACGARVVVADEELWVLATDRTPIGGVAFTRTALWFAWDTTQMSWPPYERIADADLYPYPYAPGVAEPVPASTAEVGAVLPDRYAGVLEHCWAGLPDTPEEPCHVWEAPVDVPDVPSDQQVALLVGELVEAGFFVDAADPSWDDGPLTARRSTGPGGWTGATVAVRRDGDALVARVLAL